MDAQPTDGLRRLALAAHAARIAAAALRWLAAGATALAGLLLFALLLACFERGGAAEPPEVSAAAFLDFDLAVQQALAARAPGGPDGLRTLWARRPDWQLPARDASWRLVPLRDAWAAAASERSRFRTAARGAGAALPLLLGGLSLAFAAAALAGVLASLRQGPAGRAAFAAGVWLLVVQPLWPLLDPAIFQDRTRSLGQGLSAALFIAAFAGTLSGAAARALFGRGPQAGHLGALRGRPALPTAARLAAVDAADWLLPMVPALAAAALFVCARADQDPAAQGAANGLGALVRAATRETTPGARLSSCALVAGGLLLLWVLGHRFVREVRAALSPRGLAP